MEAQSNRSRPLVLVIDDDVGIREAIVSFLDDEGFATAHVGDGVEALNYLAESEQMPDLIILDLMMPMIDGWTFCKLRHGVQSLMTIPVVAMSASSMTGDRMPFGVDGSLRKPFDPDALAWLARRIASTSSVVTTRV